MQEIQLKSQNLCFCGKEFQRKLKRSICNINNQEGKNDFDNTKNFLFFNLTLHSAKFDFVMNS